MKAENNHSVKTSVADLWGSFKCMQVMDSTAGSLDGCVLWTEESMKYDCMLIKADGERPLSHRFSNTDAERIRAVPFSGKIVLDIR